MDFKSILGTTKSFVVANAPQILTGIGVGGIITTTVLAVKATIKARDLYLDEFQDEEPTFKQTVGAVWKLYLPPLASMAISVGCIVYAQSLSTHRTMVATTAFAMADKALTEYREEVKNVVGETKERDIRDNIAKKRVEENPVSKGEVIITGNGDSLFLDMLSGRYFESSMEKVQRAFNEFNGQLIHENQLTLNELYDKLGLAHTRTGEFLGWRSDDLILINYTSTIADNGKPAVVINYDVEPLEIHNYHW